MPGRTTYTVRVKWDGGAIAGITRVSALGRSTAVVDFRDGGDPDTVHKNPGRTDFEPITIERSVTKDAAFESWASLVTDGGVVALRKDVRIEIVNRAGRVVLAFDVRRCWPSGYQAAPAIESGRPERLIESLTLQHEGWTRDASIRP